MKFTHYYRFKNNPKRIKLYGKRCAVVARGAMNSVLIEFEDGTREVVSRNAIRKIRRSDGCERRV